MTPVKLNALWLRKLADYAASLREPEGEVFYAVVTEENGSDSFAIQRGTPDSIPPLGAVLEVETKDQQPARPPARVTIQGGGMTGCSTLDGYDAVFWSEAAVEKFVFPYYASKSLWMAPVVLDALAKAWYGFVPGDGSSANVAPDEIPFAIAHLPGSDYVPLTDGTIDPAALLDDLVVLVKKMDAPVEHRSLKEYLPAAQPA